MPSTGQRINWPLSVISMIWSLSSTGKADRSSDIAPTCLRIASEISVSFWAIAMRAHAHRGAAGEETHVGDGKRMHWPPAAIR